MKMGEAIAKRLRSQLGRGGELEGVPAPIVTAIAVATIEALDERTGDVVTFPLVGADFETCEACDAIFFTKNLGRDEGGAYVCEACAATVGANEPEGG